ncbi:MAG: hypothetical protein AAGI23_10075 [Bacteroidota bacterium]
MMEEYSKSFKYWKTQEVEEVFGIVPEEDSDLMTDWLAADGDISEKEQEQLAYLKRRLTEKVAFWNEAAIKFYFIGPLMSLVDYDTDLYNSFLEQQLSVKVDESITVSGNLDFLVATGKQIPRTPFFALHEYKPEPNVSTDPMGQLLMGMVAAQKANQAKGHDYPLYGTYVVGRFWFFVILNGNTYSKSLAYDATQQDLTSIFHILKKVNYYIRQSLSAELEPA